MRKTNSWISFQVKAVCRLIIHSIYNICFPIREFYYTASLENIYIQVKLNITNMYWTGIFLNANIERFVNKMSFPVTAVLFPSSSARAVGYQNKHRDLTQNIFFISYYFGDWPNINVILDKYQKGSISIPTCKRQQTRQQTWTTNSRHDESLWGILSSRWRTKLSTHHISPFLISLGLKLFENLNILASKCCMLWNIFQNWDFKVIWKIVSKLIRFDIIWKVILFL